MVIMATPSSLQRSPYPVCVPGPGRKNKRFHSPVRFRRNEFGKKEVEAAHHNLHVGQTRKGQGLGPPRESDSESFCFLRVELDDLS